MPEPRQQGPENQERCTHRLDELVTRLGAGQSRRLDADRMMISGSGAWMSTLTPEQVSTCRLEGRTATRGVRPSVEAAFHAGILLDHRDTRYVLHFQSPYATTLACRHPDEINFAVIPEIPVYMGTVGVVPYLTPGSDALADAVIEGARHHGLLVLANHGMVTSGATLDDVIRNAVFFELACRIIVQGGDRVDVLPPDQVQALQQARTEGQKRHTRWR